MIRPYFTLQLGRLTLCRKTFFLLSLGIAAFSSTIAAFGQNAAPQQAAPASVAGKAPDTRIVALEKLLNKVAFRGHFNVDGRPMNDLKEELYEIQSAKKLPDEDLWELTAKIKYGTNNFTTPLVLQIKWAESTPVITLDRLTLPGLGTFSARVLIHDNKYAGTWTHDSVSGHLFGRIQPLDTPAEAK